MVLKADTKRLKLLEEVGVIMHFFADFIVRETKGDCCKGTDSKNGFFFAFFQEAVKIRVNVFLLIEVCMQKQIADVEQFGISRPNCHIQK